MSMGSRVSPIIFGLIFMGSLMLTICSANCVLYSAGSDVKTSYVVEICGMLFVMYGSSVFSSILLREVRWVCVMCLCLWLCLVLKLV